MNLLLYKYYYINDYKFNSFLLVLCVIHVNVSGGGTSSSRRTSGKGGSSGGGGSTRQF